MQRLELLGAQLVICLLVLPVEGLCKERVVKKILAHIALKVKKKKKRKKGCFFASWCSLTNINVLPAQSNQREEQDISVNTPGRQTDVNKHRECKKELVTEKKDEQTSAVRFPLAAA